MSDREKEIKEEKAKKIITRHQNKMDAVATFVIESRSNIFNSQVIVIGFLLVFSSQILLNKSLWTYNFLYIFVMISYFVVFFLYRIKIRNLYDLVLQKFGAIGLISTTDDLKKKEKNNFGMEISKAIPDFVEKSEKIVTDYKSLNKWENSLWILFGLIVVFSVLPLLFF